MMIEQDLGGKWQVSKTSKGGKALPALTGNVPGDVFADLLRAGEICDPFYRDNELALKWVWQADWSYSRAFTVEPALLARQKVLLRCEGLDTLATIRLNGKKIAETNNQHRIWEFEVKKLLKPGRNTLTVDFASAFNYVEKKQAERKLPGWWGHMCCAQFGWVRKSACNFGWDWGVKAVTCGIWRAIKLVAFDEGRLTGFLVEQEHGKKSVDLRITADAELAGGKALTAQATVSVDGAEVASVTAPVKAGKAGAAVKLALTIAKPQLWWPNNMGAQPLYTVEVVLKNAAGEVLDRQSKRVGLRTLRLDRHKDQWGESFQFVVNGVPFFAKGGNWIPVDGVMGRRTEGDYRRLVSDCAQANMNMLRVWGGGIYEDDVFYDACDELGICVWQDMMFACSTYPTFEKGFHDNVRAEITDNVRRLRHHASLALWNGNNELEQGLVREKWTESSMSWKDYCALFDKLIGQVVKAEDPQRDYWPGSPHSSVGNREDFNNPGNGDAHLWSVWHGKQPFEWYRTCEHRFNSEFGFQSFPEPRTVNAYTAPEDRNITSFVMEHHQRSGIGNATILHYMLDWFRLPTSFDKLLWTSQILQGMAMTYACEHWRRSMPRGMGTLYWQINDNWPVASWSSIDYHGNWKALQYMARKFFAPVLLSGLEDKEKKTIEVHLTNDNLQAVSGKYEWCATDVQGKVLAKGGKAVKSGVNGDKVVDVIKLEKVIAQTGERNLLVWLEFTPEAGEKVQSLVLFARPKHLELAREPGIEVAVRKTGEKTFRVTLSAKKPALWAWLELKDSPLKANDNFVHLRPGCKYDVVLTAQEDLSEQALLKQLRVSSLVDTY